jgi:hypothetical protein
MRLRDISDRLQEIMESDPEGLMGSGQPHALVQEIQDVQSLYRPVAGGKKGGDLVPWLTFSFEPFSGLIEPFNIYPGRFWAMQRIHKQSSGLPELVTHVTRDLPSASQPIAPDMYTSFSHSPKVETIVKKSGGTLRFFHRGNLSMPDRTTLPAEHCLPGIGAALPEGYIEDGIPGLVELDGDQLIYLGELEFYNQFRTANRPKLRNFLLNGVAVSVVARYVRDVVEKSLLAAG